MAKSTKKPGRVMLRTYQVGFGDCFMLSFVYAVQDIRHVLIDFGSTGLPNEIEKSKAKKHMLSVAEQIKKDCDGKLAAVVATHRHKDHISGFATTGEKNAAGETSGDIISKCAPDLVIQPWTENPELNDENVNALMLNADESDASREKRFTATLNGMQRVAKLVADEADRLGNAASEIEDDMVGFIHPIKDGLRKQLSFMGDNNVSNESAVMNLRTMGSEGRARFVAFGDEIDLSGILPGVDVRVLGPPTLKQTNTIVKQRSRDENEFWMFQALTAQFWQMQAATASLVQTLNERGNDSANRLFPHARVYQNFAPSDTRWFIRQVRSIRSEQLLGLVRMLDKAMNNTSVILMFEVGEKKLLFPGDAQIENWEYALGRPDVKALLRETSLYKVGHHGSRNATPKTLWQGFKNRSTDTQKPDRLQTVNSTMSGKHGHTPATAVPRQTLVEELTKLSDYHTTETIKIKERLSEVIELNA